MQIFTEQENLATLLQQVDQNGAAVIRRADGQTYTLKPNPGAMPQQDHSLLHRSPLDVPGVNTGLTMKEIVEFVHEGRGDHRW